ARMCGVRCDKFYIWFDAWGFKFFSFKWGNTEYGLGWLPLGGYVKMLGQEDNPGAIRQEIERARQELEKTREELLVSSKTETDQSDSDRLSEEKLKELAELEKNYYAPDSYLSKNVPQRMAIISAGVVMNVIFAIICATAAGIFGYPEASSRLGSVLPGTPAWEQGLQAGDIITEMAGKPVQSFMDIQMACMDGNKMNIKIRKNDDEPETEMTIEPRMTPGGMMATIGVGPSVSLSLAQSTEISPPYALTLDSSVNNELEQQLSGLKGGERLQKMNGIDVRTPSDFLHLSRLFIDQPITYEFVPTLKNEGKEPDPNGTIQTVTLPPQKFSELGIRLTMGEITSIQKGSAAEKAGLRNRIMDEKGNVVQHGDVLVEINNVPILDPVKLPLTIFKLAGKRTRSYSENVGNSAPVSVVATVLRDGKRLDIPMTLPPFASYTGLQCNQGQMASGHLGISYEVLPVISGINGTVDVAQTPIGATITGITVFCPPPAADSPGEAQKLYQSLGGKLSKQTKEKQDPRDFPIPVQISKDNVDQAGKDVVSWFTNQILYWPVGTGVELTLEYPNGETGNISTTIQSASDMFQVSRGLYFSVDQIRIKTPTLRAALKLGVDKTLESMGSVFKFLKGLGEKKVSAKALGGPITIVNVAYAMTNNGPGPFLFFLCLIGANLAVVNFLPIPVLDGGHIVFLLYEAIFRRPPNENVQVILSFIGLFLILLLMFWVIWLDISRLLV
ncbi:MAG: site-2 protease family protein, partial [Thermoguttaceae bacterium]|nr:site-2 protease family protein [Thermoguttaceae bacterium]